MMKYDFVRSVKFSIDVAASIGVLCIYFRQRKITKLRYKNEHIPFLYAALVIAMSASSAS